MAGSSVGGSRMSCFPSLGSPRSMFHALGQHGHNSMHYDGGRNMSCPQRLNEGDAIRRSAPLGTPLSGVLSPHSEHRMPYTPHLGLFLPALAPFLSSMRPS